MRMKDDPISWLVGHSISFMLGLVILYIGSDLLNLDFKFLFKGYCLGFFGGLLALELFAKKKGR